MYRILVLHGPNLNLLGTREPAHYGSVSLQEINDRLVALAGSDGNNLHAKQSNAEHDLVNWIQDAVQTNTDFIIINPAAFTHTSVAIRDALSAVEIPFVEVHLSNVHRREAFRKHSYFSDIAEGVIAGLGSRGYEYAYRFAVEYMQASEEL
jgi:3-dehydroquinate dehydratase-2